MNPDGAKRHKCLAFAKELDIESAVIHNHLDSPARGEIKARDHVLQSAPALSLEWSRPLQCLDRSETHR